MKTANQVLCFKSLSVYMQKKEVKKTLLFSPINSGILNNLSNSSSIQVCKYVNQISG